MRWCGVRHVAVVDQFGSRGRVLAGWGVDGDVRVCVQRRTISTEC